MAKPPTNLEPGKVYSVQYDCPLSGNPYIVKIAAVGPAGGATVPERFADPKSPDGTEFCTYVSMASTAGGGGSGSGGSGGGGGAPSYWFLGALILLAAIRCAALRRRRAMIAG